MVEAISFGTWLKQRRKALDLTQEALAEACACSVETIRKLEADALYWLRTSSSPISTGLRRITQLADTHDASPRGSERR